MGNGKGLTIFAIILAIIGIGLGGYPYIKEYIGPSTEDTPKIDDVLYSESRDFFFPTSSYQAIPNISIVLNVETGQDLYVLFDSQAVLRDQLGTQSISIQVTNNDVLIGASHTQVAHHVSALGGGVIRHSLNLQYVISSLTTGTYNITISVLGSGTLGEGTGNRVEDCSLFIIIYN